MHFGIIPPVSTGVTTDPEWLRLFAGHTEACGFESIVLPEHAVVVSGYASPYPYSKSGRMPVDDDCAIPDPLDTLAFLAACTTSARLATGALVLPNHHPIVLAKRAATIDQLSGGRVRLCVGVGWMREEVEACGAEFSSRGRRTDECIDAMRALWTDSGADGASFHGEFFSFDRALSFPKPVHPDGVPIHIGGNSTAAARRAGRRGDGFQPLARRDMPALLDVMRSEAGRAGRDPDRIEITLQGHMPWVTEESIDEAEALGIARMVLSTTPSNVFDEVAAEMDAFADRMGLGES